MLTTYLFGILQNAPFRSQIFKIFFASGGKGALTFLYIFVGQLLVLVSALLSCSQLKSLLCVSLDILSK